MILFCRLLPVVLLLCWIPSLHAVTNYVSLTGSHIAPYASWADAANTIQAAIDAAVDGDVVLVSNGVYNTGSITLASNMACRVAITNAITVQSVNGPAYTSIVGSPPMSSVRCAYVGTNAVLSGFSLYNGFTQLTGELPLISGGAVMCEGGTVVNCRIYNNWAVANGGGVFCNGSGTVRNCIIYSNSCSSLGGGVFLYFGGSVENCTIVTNTSSANGGGLYCKDGGIVENSIIYGNTATAIGNNWDVSGSNSVFNFNCATPLVSGTNNIAVDPLFTNSAAGDYRLSLGSPCIDSGTNAAWMSGSKDVDNNDRIMNGVVDRGCSEYVYYAITPSAGLNGAIVPTGIRYVPHGAGTNFAMYPDPHYHVLDVQVDGSSVGASNSYAFVNVTSNHAIHVLFTIDRFDLVVANEHGDAVPGAGTNTYDYGTALDCSITNSPFIDGSTTQYVCVGWVGSGSVPPGGTQTNVAITITNNSSITWQWQTNYWLATNVNGYGSIGVTNGWYTAGSNVMITTMPSNGYHFVDWTGDITSTDNPLNLLMNQPYSITANFAINMYDITPSAGANGSISPTGIIQVAHGSETNFIITPDANYHILDVIVDSVSVGPSNTYAFTGVTSNHAISALFAIDMYTLTVSTPYGFPSPAGVTTNDYGSNVSCIANSPVVDGTTQYVCVGWIGTGSVPETGFTDNVSFTITNASSLTWLWATNYWLHSVAGPDGSVDVGDGWHALGTNVTINAIPAARSYFDKWTGDVLPADATNNPLTVVMDGPHSITGNFVITTHYVSPTGSNVAPYTSWENAATNIQDAVDAAVEGERVLVTDGVYRITAQLWVTNGIRIDSVNGPEVTTIDGNDSVGCYYSGHVSNIVDGFTIQAGFGTNGGGVELNGGLVRNCIFRDNTADYGGGAYLYSGAVLRSCRVFNNSANQGGGVSIGDTGSVQNCTIVNNVATNSGGGLYSTSDVTIVNSIVCSNSAPVGTNYFISGNLLASYSCATPLLAGVGNLDSDPLLTPSLLLQGASPCIDSGNSTNVPLTDIQGRSRWDHPGHVNVVSIHDMGADEFIDNDGDGMADYWEILQFGAITNSNGAADTDADSLVDLQEYNYSMCPTNSNTYYDSLNDAWKVIYGFTQAHELGGLSLAEDSDQDGLLDSWELTQWGDLTQGPAGDPDGDTVSNWGEYLIGTDPRIATGTDTDVDTLTDGAEINTYFTDPRLADTDGDSFGDGVEVVIGTDPRNIASFPATIAGAINYSGIQTGQVWIVVTNSAISTNVQIAVPGIYSITNRHTITNHWISAFRDMNGNGLYDTWEAFGSYSNNALYLTNDVAGIDITIVDPQYNFVVAGNPSKEGSPVPFGYGTNLVTSSTVLSNEVAERVVNGATQYVCTGWSGAGSVPLSGATTSVVVTVTNASTLTWNWLPESYQIMVTAGPNGGVSGTSGWYSAGSLLTNTVTPSNGYHFAGWTGNVPPANTNDTTLVLAVDQARSITANFAINMYTITPTVVSNGVISPSSPVQVPHGGTTNFTITPDVNHHIVSVQVDGVPVGATNGWTFSNVTTTHTINVNFAIDIFSITASAGTNGTISPLGVVSLPYGGGTNFIITPDPNYYIVDVLVDLVSVGPVTNYTFTSISSNHTLDASFDDRYALTVGTPHGTSVPNGFDMYKYGTNVSCSLINSPFTDGNTQYVCLGWAGTGSVPATGSGTNVIVTVTNTSTLAWAWTTNYWLHAVSGPDGEIDVSDYWVGRGSNVTINATASNHYHFVNWTGTITSTNNPLVLSMGQAHSVSANFAIDTYGITATAGGNGSIVPSGTVQVPYNSATNFVINPNPNYHITNVVVDGVPVGVTNGYSFLNVTNTHSIEAGFGIDMYELAVNSSLGTPSPSGISSYGWGTLLNCSVAGSPVTLGMTQYVCNGWTGTGSAPASGAGTNASFSITNNSTLIWNWQTMYQLNAVAGPNGAVTATNGWHASGAVTLISATPIADYHFTGWTGDIIATNNPQAVLMNRGYAVTANFALNTYNITATAGANGTITPSGVISVSHGGSNVFTITPDTYCYVSNVVVDGISIGSTNMYVFTNVTAGHTIDAVFAFSNNTLSVTSAYGSPSPARGTNVLSWGDVVNCVMGDSSVTAGLTQYVCVGWMGTGSVPSSGNGTNVTFTLTNNSTIIWQWRTNYWLDTTSETNGSVDVGDGWYKAGTNVTITATAQPGYWFDSWIGDVPSADVTKNPLTLTMSVPRAVTATFDLSPYYVSTKGMHIWPFTSWQNAATNIQSAVNVAGDGRLVLVSNGTYIVSSHVYITNGIVIRSVNGSGTTTIDGGSAVRCMYVSHSNAIVDGFTFTHGKRTGDGNGGGLMIENGGLVRNCIFNNNSATNYGGGVYMYYGGILSNCTFSGNLALYGGAVQCDGSGQVLNCTMSGNSAYFGGGLRLRNGGIATNCTIKNNTAYLSGGGVQIAWTGVVDGCTINGNISSNYGGGVYCYQGGFVTNSTISNNKSVYGGGVQIDDSGSVDKSIFNGNSATYGGGLRLKNGGIARSCIINNNTAYAGGGVQHVSSGTLRNCSVSGNIATNNGGGVYCYQGGAVENCVISGNNGGSAGGLLAESGGTILNTIIQFNGAGSGTNYLNTGSGMIYSNCCTVPLVEGGGNITGDPRFLDAGTADFHLLSGSPCVDAGISQSWMTNSVDMDGNPRLAGRSVDIGIYEAVDSDNDGLPDADETGIYGTDPNNSDTDGDNMLDGIEIIAGTSPLVGSDVLKVTQVVMPEDNTLVITWQSYTGRLYSVLATRDLVALPWTNLSDFADVSGTGGFMSWTNSLLLESQDFYRIGVRLAP